MSRRNNKLPCETPVSSRCQEQTSMQEVLKAIQALQQTVNEVRAETVSNWEGISKIDQDEGERCTAKVVCSGGEGIRLYDLPKFNGNAEQWPLFRASFEDTTKTFKYTNRHNLMRLQKCLMDEAKDVVQSLLIYLSNVPAVMGELEFRFGRPDLLIRSQLDNIQQFERVTERNVDSLIALSSLVRNVVAFLSSAKCEQHLNNPILLEQLVYKLPPNKQFEWARHAVILKECPTIKQFNVWLSEMAQIICLLPQPLCQSKTEKPKITMPATQNYTRRVMYAQNHEMEQENHLEVKCFECAGQHLIVTCEAFLSKNVQQRWVKVKQLRLCFSCLRKVHNVIQCRMKRFCGINGCRKNHNRLLYESQQVPPTSGSVQQVLSCAKP
ncbi:uncharacterized protein LOC119690221 [Teleopsis dalmanni]|uniref:uncharacterized protein LOC119661997 n=1 Tax=Teleopsis dalmanni TaxID=139649 RepID=UPI0018CDF362|nr:uncharacterized protein LOC119661997 [Teleopsis dalmanni]XP_037961168.1 uncharacterized protein LOC119690221 [Teleopsis dalmanni]